MEYKGNKFRVISGDYHCKNCYFSKSGKMKFMYCEYCNLESGECYEINSKTKQELVREYRNKLTDKFRHVKTLSKEEIINMLAYAMAELRNDE